MRPLYQLSHNHCPRYAHFVIILAGCSIFPPICMIKRWTHKSFYRISSLTSKDVWRLTHGLPLWRSTRTSPSRLTSEKRNLYSWRNSGVLRIRQSVWPELAIFCTLGNHSKPVATLILPKSLTFLGNFCLGVKIYHFASEIIFGQLL